MDPTRRLRPAPGLVLRREDDEAFLLEPAAGRIKLLNATGLEVWELLDGRRDAGAVARALGAAHPDADPDAVARDVAQFLEELAAAGLVEAVAADG
jgi:hypothetical protein